MREEIKMKQGIVVIALILLFCGYYLTPSETDKSKDSVEPAPCITNTQMQSLEISNNDCEFKESDSDSEGISTHWNMDNFLFSGKTIR